MKSNEESKVVIKSFINNNLVDTTVTSNGI